MGKYRRINISSGRPLEPLAHYSRALRCGDQVLQSGTTAIDTEGNIIGENDVAAQVDAIVEISRGTMGDAGGKLEDVVRSRIYITDIGLADDAMRAFGKHFGDIRPAATLVEISRLARPTQLIEIEFDAIDGAAGRARRISSGRPLEEQYGYSRAVRMGDTVYVSGTTARDREGNVVAPGDQYRQARACFEIIEAALDEAGASLADMVYSKTFVTDMAKSGEQRQAKLEMLGDIRPTGTLLGIPALIGAGTEIEIEAEAIVGAAGSRREFYTANEREKARGYARAVAVGDVVHVSGCTSVDADGKVQAPGDWAAQVDLCHEAVADALAMAGLELDDVVRRRSFTVAAAEQNRAYGEGPGWFRDSRPVSMGCRIDSLADPAMLVEVDAVAVKGAREDIEWLGPQGSTGTAPDRLGPS